MLKTIKLNVYILTIVFEVDVSKEMDFFIRIFNIGTPNLQSAMIKFSISCEKSASVREKKSFHSQTINNL